MTYHLLIVEDSVTQAERMRAILAEAGYATTVTRSGEEALACLHRTARFDLVLSDIMMPGINGFQLCERVKTNPATSTVPVLLLTSLRDPLDVVRALEVGADYFIHKPYETDHLLSRVRMTLDNRKRRADDPSTTAPELSLKGRSVTIDADRQQLVDLLVTTFEDLVGTNERLRANEEQLAEAQHDLAAQLRAADLQHRHLATLLDAMPDAVFVTDVRGRITTVNRAAAALTGQDLWQLTDQRLTEALALFTPTGTALTQGDNPLEPTDPEREFQNVRAEVRGGQRLPVSVRTAVVEDERGRKVAAMAVVRDVSAETFTDAITGLPTRALFLDRLEQAVLHTHWSGEEVELVVVSIERLDLVADSYGPKAREQLLAQIAQRLRSELHETDTLADLGDNEFAVLCGSLEGASDLLRLAGRLTDVLTEPFAIETGTVALRGSAGVALGSGSDLDATTLLQQASTAAHRARTTGQHAVVFDPSLQDTVFHVLQLETDLVEALSRGEFVVHYQPEVLLADGAILGTEALLRWRHPRRGLLAPGSFMDVAEDRGLIVPIGAWVLREACRQTAAWNARRGAGFEPLFVAVNIAACQLDSDRLLTDVEETLSATALPPSCLMLEITETAVMRDPDAAASRLRTLKDLGVQLALDDFGTGHASLEYLRKFPFDVIKVDRSFVHDLQNGGQAVVQAVISLGEAFGLVVVAEGVETEEQRDELAALGCPVAAGYLFHRPQEPAPLSAIVAPKMAGA